MSRGLQHQTRYFATDMIVNDVVKPSRAWCYLLILGVMALVIYFNGSRIKYYSDDFLYYSGPLTENIFSYSVHGNPNIYPFYRPVETFFLSIIQRLFGMQTL